MDDPTAVSGATLSVITLRSRASWLMRVLEGAEGPARMLAVFPRHVHIALGSSGDVPRIVILTRAGTMPGPLNAEVDFWPDWSRASDGTLAEGKLRLGGVVVNVASGQILSSGIPASVVAPARSVLLRMRECAAQQVYASELLRTVLGHSDAVPGDCVSLAVGLARGDRDCLAEGALALAGLGPGLTPAGDDFLCGVATALWQVGQGALAPALAQAARGRTTTLSQAYLEAACAGQLSRDWQILLGTPVPLTEDVAAVMAHGHSSGADTLAGYLWAGWRLT